MVAIVATLAVALPSTAAGKHYAPPGKAGASEYFETVPAPGGNVAPPTNPTAATGKAISKIGRGAVGTRKLQKLGKDGQSAAALAKATAPVVAPASTVTPSKHSRSTSKAAPTVASGGSAVSGMLHLLGGSDQGGIGAFLPLLLAFGLGAAVAIMAVRLRHARRPSA